MSLLGEDDPPVFTLMNAASGGPFLLTADHAGRVVPHALGDLGVGPADMDRHIAWDIGIAGVTRKMAELLGTPAILQTYSRLVIDCNRLPSVPSAFPTVSEATPIPGNENLDAAAKLARRQAIFDPYHAEIERLIAAWPEVRPIYVAMHSFTPVYLQIARGMHVAVLFHRAPRAGRLLASLLRQEPGLVVGENEPYQVSDETDYGVPVHAEKRGLDYVEIEIRQDLIQDASGQTEWAHRLAKLLPIMAERLKTEREQ